MGKGSNNSTKKTPPKKKSSGSSSKGDTETTILKYLSEMAEINQTKVKESALLKAAGYAGADSKGYRIPLKELINTKGWVFKESSGDKNKEKLIGLTEAGRDHCISIGMLVVPKEPETQEEHINQIKTLLDKDVQGATRKSADKIWKALEDGKYHTIQELLEATGYSGADSKGYRNAKNALLNRGLVEKDPSGKSLRFTEKMYRFIPRP